MNSVKVQGEDAPNSTAQYWFSWMVGQARVEVGHLDGVFISTTSCCGKTHDAHSSPS